MIILVVCVSISQNLESKWKMKEKKGFFYFTSFFRNLSFPKTMQKSFKDYRHRLHLNPETVKKVN